MVEIDPIPIVRLYDVLIVSIQKDLSDQLVLRLKKDITETIQRHGAAGLIIDVSGIGLMDSFITKAVNDMGKIAGFMGVQTAIAGIDPMIAFTLVEMGLDVEGVRTTLNLESALESLDLARARAALNDPRDLREGEDRDEEDEVGSGDQERDDVLLMLLGD
jgi:rsbT antagonist protein RsbS